MQRQPLRPHAAGVEDAHGRLESRGMVCRREVKLDSRRPDLGCSSSSGETYAEIKTPRDVRTTRSRAQMTDIAASSTRRGAAAVVYVTGRGCFSPLNEKGERLIEKAELPRCPCPVQTSNMKSLTSCLTRL